MRPAAGARRAARLVTLLLTTATLDAAALPVRVRGGAALRGQARVLDDGRLLELRGRLQDDTLAPMASAPIRLTGRGLHPSDGIEACARRATNVRRAGEGLRIQSDAAGAFCLRWRGAPPSGVIHLAFAGDDYHAAAALDVSFDEAAPQRLATRLRFSPRPTVLDLDTDSFTVSAQLELELATAAASRADRTAVLTDERRVELARGRTGGDGKVHLRIESRRLAGPGAGRLRLAFTGSSELGPARDEQPVVRRATVALGLAAPLGSAHAGEPLPIEVSARTSRGPVPGGVVEARADGGATVSAPVRAGRARLAMPVDSDAAAFFGVTLRFLPAAPWYAAGAPLRLRTAVTPPSLLGRVALAALVLLAGAWVVLGWRRSGRQMSPERTGKPLRPGVQLIRRGKARRGWRGTAVDAHDGRPLAGVAVLVRAPSLADDGVLCEQTSDQAGRFTLALQNAPPGAELVARAPRHSELRQPMPKPGEIRVALMTRRRAVLARFVAWARRRGHPFDARPEPTPGAARAAGSGDAPVRRWTTKVEHAAFGPREVDAAVEQQLRDEEP